MTLAELLHELITLDPETLPFTVVIDTGIEDRPVLEIVIDDRARAVVVRAVLPEVH